MSAPQPKILVVDDAPAIRTAMQLLFELHDLPCVCADGPDAALATLRREAIGVVVQDMNFAADTTSGQEGVALYRAIREHDAELPVVLITAWTSLETAVQLVKEGATDYLAKPWDDQKLLATVRAGLARSAQRLAARMVRGRGTAAREALAARADLCGIVYESEAMQRAVAMAVDVARSDAPVLITGPNGAGKERVAEIIQRNSARRGGPFVRVNAGALPEELMEAELFGAEPGAYTGAAKRRTGRFEAADGGTLFLDEIGNLSLSGQMKLLRVLQTGEFERLGSSATQKVDVRVLSATNADLEAAIAAGTFREDLYYRLNVVELRVPPLRERPEDVVPLARSFLAELSAGAAPPRLSEGAVAALRGHAWPGNVRELRNRVQRALLLGAAGAITPEALGLTAGGAVALDADEEQERRELEQALLEAGGVVSKAAAALGLSRQALYRKMERLGVVLKRRPGRS